ncbi:STAS domain-containing protein [Kitasatospora sp. LaBMicrA B282]|uniref:STAS domain-containing protein n=1 Tax=Kitasatospora sp. LaBMicrA B282 TaxID=3420949 RepID=UPI003D10DC11
MTVEVRSRDHGGVTVVELEGEITSVSSAELQQRILPLIGGTGTTVIDLAKVPYISSAGLRTLLLVHRQALRRQTETVLVGLCDEVRFVMSATGFLEFFDVRESAASVLGSAGG